MQNQCSDHTCALPNSLAQRRMSWKRILLFSFQSLGVIYGQISTAPLYVFGTICEQDIKSEEAVYELFSFIFWTMTIISLLKYSYIVLMADDDGEGGTFALYSLLCRHAKVGLLPIDRSSIEAMNYEAGSPFEVKVESRARRAIAKHKSSQYLVLFLALFGSCMTIGVGVLTPALSVFSASSGVQRSLSDMTHKIFSSQSTQQSVSRALERCKYPSICTSSLCMCYIVGIYNIFYWNKRIILAISPVYMYRFVQNIGVKSWRSLGSIILCLAGLEAMFADLGHFSKKSIKIAFVCLIYPVLIACYAGQASYMSKNLHAINFNHLSESVPAGAIRHSFVALSLLASVVGSQATITASFSVINQCLSLNCFPRVKVIHTSDKIRGQVYIPDVNWLLMILSLTVTIVFRNIVKIGNAAGLAVISGMLVTTCLMSLVIALYWEKSLLLSACFLIFFGFIEITYLSACMLNFHRGAWYLVFLLALSLTVMLAWHYGTKKKYEFDLENKVTTEWLTELSLGLGVCRVPGIGFIYTDIVTGIPSFFSHFIANLPAFHQVLIFVSFKSLPVPYVPPSRRYLIGRVGPKDYKIYRCIVRHGYRDHIKDTDDFEEEIIRSIGEFIAIEDNDLESLNSQEGRMIVIGKPLSDGNALVPLNDTNSYKGSANFENNYSQTSTSGSSLESSCAPVNRKKVRFMLPPNSPKMQVSVRKELQELIDARESGTAYVLGQSHLALRQGSNFLKRFLIKTYIFCDKNCRETPVALNIPHAALVEVGMVYTI
ncbi:hypothetical protein CIPAW_15G146500 [Carya illinoinensis]|uniref:Potassium transporter n=2 Tax=Carya illinoinensis TaxID=32201 RepID=A0A8T1N7J7_CARIL|nr:hypothetical protein CIPAW_15G146500 [Carya illinoinensis]